MKYRLTESQNQLISSLKKRKRVKEQEYIIQSYSPTMNEDQPVVNTVCHRRDLYSPPRDERCQRTLP